MTQWEQTQREEALRLLENYRAGKIDESDYHSMIVQWGKAHLLEARSAIEPFLQSSNPSLRGTALRTLAGPLHILDYWATAVHFLFYDPYYIVRSEGALALAQLKVNTNDRQTLALLANIVDDSYEDDSVRKDTYRAMRVVEAGSWEPLGQPPEYTFILERDADWDFVKTSIDPTLKEEWRVKAFAWLERYYRGEVTKQEYYEMLLRFGRARVQEARPVIEPFLNNASLPLRIVAFRVLVLYLQIPGNWQMAVDALQHNPNIDYRQEAATILGQLMQGTRDKATLRALAPFFFDDQVDTQVFMAMEKVYAGYSGTASYDEIEAFLATSDTDDKAE